MNQELILILRELQKPKIYLGDRVETCLIIAIENKEAQLSHIDCYGVKCGNCPCSFLPNRSHYINHIRNLPIPIKEINE